MSKKQTPPDDYQLDMSNGNFSTGVITDIDGNHDNLDFVLERFKLNPKHYEIINDQLQIKSWDVPYRDETGELTTMPGYSYNGKIRKISLDEEGNPVVDIDKLRKRIAKIAFKPLRRTKGMAEPCGTYTFMVADPQLGKKNTMEAVDNWVRGVEGHLQAVRDLIKIGQPPEAIHIAFMGDETEGVANNYGNQAYTVEMNLSSQLELDTELRLFTIKETLKLGIPVSVSSVISNHGEWTRNGSKDVVTTKSDNSSTHIARQLKRMFDEFASDVPLTWHIADSDPAVVVELSGVKTYFSHGHIAKGRGTSTELRTKVAVERQILGDPGFYSDIPLYITAHYHHEGLITDRGRFYVSCPALEAEKSSEYMLDQYGVWSPAGLLGFLVGADLDPARPFTRWSIF
jgi:hypothetical protein